MQEELSALSGDSVESQQARIAIISDLKDHLSKWARKELKATVEYALSLDERTRKDLPLRRLFEGWAERDPDGALARAKGLTDEGERAEALMGVLPVTDRCMYARNFLLKIVTFPAPPDGIKK
jgi:hypothetical protein